MTRVIKLVNQGGSELTIKDKDGLIRSKDTITSGSYFSPPKDKEHYTIIISMRVLRLLFRSASR
jgi:hypothetical protein